MSDLSLTEFRLIPKRFKEIKKKLDKNKIIRGLRILYESEEEDYYEPQKIKTCFEGNYIEYESKGDKDKRLSIEEYLNMIRPYLSNIIHEDKDGWKIQLTIEVAFVSVIRDSNESYTIHMHTIHSFISIGYETNNIIKEIFKYLLEEYQEILKIKMKKVTLFLIVLMHSIISFIK